MAFRSRNRGLFRAGSGPRAATSVPQNLSQVVGWWDQSQAGGFSVDRIGTCTLSYNNVTTATLGSYTGITQSTGNGFQTRAQNLTASPVNGVSTFGVTVVAKNWDNAMPAPTLVDARPGGTGNAPIAYGLSSGSVWKIGNVTFATPWDANAHAWYFEFNGNSSKVYKDGVQIGTTFACGTTTAGAAIAFLNAITNPITTGGNESLIVLGEAKITTGTQTAQAVATEAIALLAKWGLPITFSDATAHDIAVPTGYTSATLEVWGAGRGGYGGNNGLGAYAAATVTGLTAGETLRLTPGGRGVGAGAGGFNGGGACGALGGSDGCGGDGASDIRRGGTALANRILVGGGGGGGTHPAGGSPTGGNAGHTVGFAGTGISGSGGGGTQSAGGAAGGGGAPGFPGTLGQGGSSSGGPGGGRGGGGGGGGYYGGGSGWSGFGVYYSGGGGSSYVDPSLTLISAETTGTWDNIGKVQVTFIP